jgi:hypothetical protein
MSRGLISWSRSEVLNQNVRLPDQVVHDGQPIGLLQIDDDAAFIAVEREEGRHLACSRDVLEAMGPVEFARPGRLDLQDIRSEVPQAHAGERARQHLRAIQDRDAVQGARGSRSARAIASLLHFPLANKYY